MITRTANITLAIGNAMLSIKFLCFASSVAVKRIRAIRFGARSARVYQLASTTVSVYICVQISFKSVLG